VFEVDVGARSGRYLYELRLIETFGLQETIRAGFSSAGSSLFLSDTDESIGFSNTGDFFHGRKKTERACPIQWRKGAVLGVLLNLVEGAPNAFTISLFKDGKRVSKPMPLPESLKGKTLYPSVTFKNVTLSMEFGGPTGKPLKPLPFAVRMLQDAAAEDVEENSLKAPEKPEAVFPVALPDEGGFDYVDQLLEKAAGSVVELSDRAVAQWASKSGNKQGRENGKPGESNDRPSFAFGNELDQPSTRRTLKAIAPFAKRNFVVAEVLGNLTKAGRAEALAQFKGKYRCVARVLMGKPPADWIASVQARLLADKEKTRHQAVEKKKQAFLRAQRTKKADAARKLRLKDAEKKKKQKNNGEEVAETPVEEAVKEPEEVFDPDTEGSSNYVPPASLSEEEKALVFTKKPLPDVAPKLLASKYTKFELPVAEEGFDAIEFMWEPLDVCAAALSKYIKNKKLSTPIENLKPSEWFAEKLKAFETAKKKLRSKVSATKASKKTDERKDGEKDGEKKEGEKKEGEKKDGEEKDTEADAPVQCANFAFEDWVLLSIRFELFLLAHAFNKDVDDPDRPAMPLNHLGFYYQKYFKKQFSAANFACKTAEELIQNQLFDSVKVGEGGVLQATLPEDTVVGEFVGLVEQARAERLRRAEAGDESAVLKFPRTGMASNGKGVGKMGGRKGQENGKLQAKGGGGKGKDRGPTKARIAERPVGAGGRAFRACALPTERWQGRDRATPRPASRWNGPAQRSPSATSRPWQAKGGAKGHKRPIFTSSGGGFRGKQQRRY